MRGNFEEAIKEFKNILQADPANYDARYTLGKVYEDQKRAKEAMKAYKEAYVLMLKKTVAGE